MNFELFSTFPIKNRFMTGFQNVDSRITFRSTYTAQFIRELPDIQQKLEYTTYQSTVSLLSAAVASGAK